MTLSKSEINGKVPRFRRTIDTQTVIDRLEKTAPGELVTYKELSELIGRDIADGARHVLQSAKRALQKHRQMVFAAVTKQGVRRLDDAGIVDTGTAAVKRIGRAARHAGVTLACADFDKLDDGRRVKHNAVLSYFGVVEAISKKGAIAKIETRVAKTQQRLPLMKTLDAFREDK